MSEETPCTCTRPRPIVGPTICDTCGAAIAQQTIPGGLVTFCPVCCPEHGPFASHEPTCPRAGLVVGERSTGDELRAQLRRAIDAVLPPDHGVVVVVIGGTGERVRMDVVAGVGDLAPEDMREVTWQLVGMLDQIGGLARAKSLAQPSTGHRARRAVKRNHRG